MGWFSGAQTETVELPGGNRATVRKLSYGEQQEVISAAGRIEWTGGRPEPVMDVARLRQEQTRRSVCAWEGPDFEGRPCTPANVDALPADIGNLLEAAAERVNMRLTDEEKKGSAGRTS